MKRKALIAIIVTLVVIFIALYLYKRRKSQPVKEVSANPPATTTPSGPVANDNFPLVKGSAGENVRYLQWAINRIAPGANLLEDGKFGDKTYSALLVNIGASYYPITQAKWTTILNRANNQ